MGKNKDLFTELREHFSNLPTFSKILDEFTPKYYSKETFVAKKGNVESTITVFFSKEGYPLYSNFESKVVLSDKERKIQELETQIEIAAFLKNYKRAAELQDEINKLKTN